MRSKTFKTEASHQKMRRGSEHQVDQPSSNISGDKIEDALCNRKLEAASVSSGQRRNRPLSIESAEKNLSVGGDQPAVNV